MPSQIVFEDAYGEVIDRPGDGFMEIRWFDTTNEMTEKEFQDWLLKFTDLLEKSSSKRVLVDGISFQFQSMGETMDWRDEVIIPRYNALGITRFAFQLPSGSPPIGNTPAPEGSANFPTGYFALRAETTEWLAT